MKRTLWISAIALALLSLTCLSFAAPQLSTTAMNVQVQVVPFAGVWGTAPAPIILANGGSWFSSVANLSGGGNVAADVSANLTTNNLPAGVYLNILPSTTAQVAALAIAHPLNANGNYQSPIADNSMYGAPYLASGAHCCSWGVYGTNGNQATGLQTPALGTTSWPIIYTIVDAGEVSPVTALTTSVLTYTVTSQ
ncbi:MAG TPA: hypothetical protein VGM19_09410 [Armatimonadota bacterium]|jgi:hypothetical protein